MAKHACHKKRLRVQPYRWMGAGVITVGLGAAALTGAGVAVAQDAGSETNSATPSGVTSSKPSDSESPKEADSPSSEESSGSADDDAATDEDADSAADEVEQTVESRRGKRHVTRREIDGAQPEKRDATSDVSTADATSDVSTADASPDVGADDAPPPVSQPVVVKADPFVERELTAAPRPATALLATPERAASISTLVSGPASPTGSALAWVLLAAARRQVGRTADEEFLDAANALATEAINTAPTAVLRRQGSPSFSGKVTGSITAGDPDGDRLTYSATATSKGTVKVTTSGSFTYTPTAAARHAAASATATVADKSDTFTIVVSDGKGGLAQVPVTVSIKPANSAPSSVRSTKASPDPVSGVVTGRITAKDRDADTLTYTVSAPSKGSVTVNSDGSFTYTASDAARASARAKGRAATDSFKVTVDDGHGGLRSTTVRVTVAPANSAPASTSPTFTKADTSTGTITGKINAVDPDGDRISYTRQTVNTAKGVLNVRSDGTFTYTPTAAARHDAASDDSALKVDVVSVSVRDRLGAVGSVTLSVPILSTNTPPRELSATVSTPDPVTGLVTGTMQGKDSDGDTLTYSGSSATPKGDVVINADGHFAYTPRAASRAAATAENATAADKSDSFTVTVSDGHGGTVVATVHVAIAPTYIDGSDGINPVELHGLVTAGSVDVVQNANGTVRVIEGSFTTTRVHDSAAAATVLNQLAAVLGATPDFADASHITVRTTSQQTEDGVFTETYYRLTQTVGDVAVLGGEIILVTDDAGVVTAVFNRYDTRAASVATTPTVDGDDAEAVAAAHLITQLGDLLADAAARQAFLSSLTFQTSLAIDNSDAKNSPRLVWQVVTTTPESDPELDDLDTAIPSFSTRYLIFASGAVAGQIATSSWEIDGVNALVPSTDTARDKLNKLRAFNIQTAGSISILVDSIRNIKVYTGTATPQPGDEWKIVKGGFVKKGAGFDPTVGFYSWDPSAVSALANIAFVYDYYKNTLGKSTYQFADRYGLANGIKVVLVGDNYANASYILEEARFAFGLDTEAAMDVVAHEFTHAVIGDIVGRDASYGLIGSVESRALNEAYSDILGNLIEIQFDPTADRWTIAERAGCGQAGRVPCRRMSDVKTYSDLQDASEPYQLMGVFNYAAYRMMHDYSATSDITASKWTRVFYNSLQRLYFGATFTDAASAILSSAKAQGFTGSQIAAVEDAFRQAEILTASGYVPPAADGGTTTTPVHGVACPGTPTPRRSSIPPEPGCC